MSFLLRKGTAFAAVVVLAAAAFLVGIEVGEETDAGSASFHDMYVLAPDHLMSLVDGEDPEVRRLAARLGSPEEAYRHVRDRVAFAPSRPAGSPAETLAEGEASCLGKSALLASLLRAQGMSPGEVRVVTGQVHAGGDLVEHAWLEIEEGGECRQLDATPMLGSFEYGRFRGIEYTDSFVRRELFVFNDRDFAVISQRNRFRRPR